MKIDKLQFHNFARRQGWELMQDSTKLTWKKFNSTGDYVSVEGDKEWDRMLSEFLTRAR